MTKITLFAAALALLGVSLTSCDKKATTTTSETETSTTASGPYSGALAFIRIDSMMRGYGMYIDLSAEFTAKQQKVEAELTQKGRALEREAMDYQEKAQKGLITRFQAQSTEEGLQKKQQDIIAYRDRVMQELAAEEQVMSNIISQEINKYLEEYNAVKKYSMILGTQAGSPVLIGDPSLDITKEVLDELNKRYLESKSKESTTKK